MAKPTAVSKKARAEAERQQQFIAVIGIVAVIIVFFAILLAYLARSTSNTPAAVRGKYSDIPQSTTADGAPVIGDPKSKAVLVEYADFSCPHCMEYHATMQQFIDTYVKTGQSRLIFRVQTFVGGQISAVAAQAALCAGKQNNFWEMQDALWGLLQTYGSSAYDLTLIKQAAEGIGLNGDQLVSCIAQQETKPAIDASAKMGQQVGLTGTPGIMISADGGQTFRWFNDQNSKPLTGGALPLSVLGDAVTQANRQ